jgi:hypothetical protein
VLGTCLLVAAGAATAGPTASRLPPWLTALGAEATVTIETLAWRGLEFREAVLPLSLREDGLRITGGQATLAGGTVRFDATHARDGVSTLLAEGRGIELGRLGALGDHFTGVPMDVTVDLMATGAGLSELAATAHGRVHARNTGGGSVTRTVERVQGSLLSGLFAAFTPERDADPETVLECLALELPFDNGQIAHTNLLELRTQRMTVHGGGRIDLARGEVDLRFRPEARRGIELKSLKRVEAVVVHGPLAAPQVDVDVGGLLDRAAGLGADVATFGGGAVIGALIGRDAPAGLCDGAPPGTPAGAVAAPQR